MLMGSTNKLLQCLLNTGKKLKVVLSVSVSLSGTTLSLLSQALVYLVSSSIQTGLSLVRQTEQYLHTLLPSKTSLITLVLQWMLLVEHLVTVSLLQSLSTRLIVLHMKLRQTSIWSHLKMGLILL